MFNFTRNIGDKFTAKINNCDITLEVVKSPSCKDCYFFDKFCIKYADILGNCYDRPDEFIIFKKIN